MKLKLALLLLLCLVPGLISADVNVKGLAELESQADTVVDEKKRQSLDRMGRTPLNTLLNLRDAIEKEDWGAAAQYIDTRYLPSEVSEIGAPELIRRLSVIWRQQKMIDFSTISDDPEGNLDDGLPAYRDLLGEIILSNGTVPIYLQRIPGDNGSQIWKISNASLKQVPDLWQEFGYSPALEAIGQWLPDITIFNMENWQLAAFLLLIVIAFFMSRIVAWLMSFACRGEVFGPISQKFVRRNFRWFLFFKLIDVGLSHLGLSLKAKVWLMSGVLDYLALLFILLGIVEIFTAVYLIRSEQANNKMAKAVLRPLSTMLKVVVTIVVILNWLSDAGFNIATLLTGLGIGSLAIALAAQKTLENVFGAFTMYVARPISPGDFCKFGDIMGTVEEIGLRSTRIRTLDRKVVHVPNSEFSAKNLENISEIDRRHYRQDLRIGLETSPDQIRQLLIILREILLRHEKVLEVARRVRFEDIANDALVIVVNAYVASKSVVEFKAVAEDLNLRILEAMRSVGVPLVPPLQQITAITKTAEHQCDEEEKANKLIEDLVSEGKLPFPDFDSQTKEAFKNTISWPPKGSVINKDSE